LGGAALSGDLAPGGSPLANAKLAFTSSLVRPLTVDTLDAPADFNLSDPGGTEEIVDAWRHAAITEYTLPSVVEARYATYTLYTGQGTLEFEFPKEAGSAYVPCEGEYYRPRYDGTVEEGGGDRTNPNDPLAASLPAGHVASWSFASSFGSYGSPYAGSTGETDEPPVKTALAVATARCAGAAKSGMARVVVGTSGTKDRYLYVLIGGLGGDYYATATFGQGGTQVSVESSVVARPAEGDPAAMSLYRVLVPAGATGNVTFSMAENPAPDQDATLIIGGASIQRIPDWGGCEVSAEFKWGKLLTGSQDDNQEYKDEDLALAPYFQQFQLRGLLNTVDLTDLPMSAFDQGRLSAAYCEAKAWPDEEVDLESGEMRDRLHPAQNGYGEENGNETPESGIVRFDQEDDEAQGLDGDETDPGAQDKSKLKQPMVKLTKRAFTCDEAAESPIADGAIDPNKLIKWDPESQTEKAADGCHEVTNAVAINSGTRVYWVFTVVNIGLFGAIYVPESGTFTVEDYVNSSSDPESCDLKWELTAASTPAGVPRFEVHTIAEEYLGKPIWPTQGRVCVSSEVVW
ncbi:MAG: hypothetical protein LBD51_03085, partial [Bifidobacteriaceae bacterium]|nr:hypothetical protein [Bifidobacteriaceae bacterium]